MYPSYISYAESGYIYLGEHETGDIIKLNLADGKEETVWNGHSAFFGTGLYTPKDVIEMSMSSMNNFTALVKDAKNDSFQFLNVQDGQAYVITQFQQSGMELVRIFVLAWLVFALIGLPMKVLTITMCTDEHQAHHGRKLAKLKVAVNATAIQNAFAKNLQTEYQQIRMLKPAQHIIIQLKQKTKLALVRIIKPELK